MLTLRDCIELCDVTEDEIAGVAEHERIPMICARPDAVPGGAREGAVSARRDHSRAAHGERPPAPEGTKHLGLSTSNAS